MRAQFSLGMRMVLPALALVLIDSAIGAQTPPRSAGLGGWRIAGRDLDNSRNQPSEHQIGAANVSGLVPRWVFTTGGDVSATPTVAGNSVYFPDWDGSLYSVRADTGELQWRRSIADYNGQPGRRKLRRPLLTRLLRGLRGNGSRLMPVTSVKR